MLCLSALFWWRKFCGRRSSREWVCVCFFPLCFTSNIKNKFDRINGIHRYIFDFLLIKSPCYFICFLLLFVSLSPTLCFCLTELELDSTQISFVCWLLVHIFFHCWLVAIVSIQFMTSEFQHIARAVWAKNKNRSIYFVEWMELLLMWD